MAGYEAPRRWPYHCTQCGARADPDFDEPWSHDAREPWLRQQLAISEPGVERFWEGQLIAWKYREALRNGDYCAAEATRADGQQLTCDDQDEITGGLQFMIVNDSLDHDRLDAAADELTFWNARSVTDGVDNNGARRTNCRGLLSSMLSFLEHPQGARHPATDFLRAAAAELRDAIQDILTVDLARRARNLEPGRFEPAPPPTSLPNDLVNQLIIFGRFSFDPMNSDIDSGVVWSQIVAPHHEAAVADPDRFCRKLVSAVQSADKWAVYGAQRLVVELLGGDYRGKDFLVIQDTALDWLHEQGVSSAHLTGYEMARWTETRGAWTGTSPLSGQ